MLRHSSKRVEAEVCRAHLIFIVRKSLQGSTRYPLSLFKKTNSGCRWMKYPFVSRPRGIVVIFWLCINMDTDNIFIYL